MKTGFIKLSAFLSVAAAVVAVNAWVAANPPSVEPILTAQQPLQQPGETLDLRPLPPALEATQLSVRPIFRVSRRPWAPPPPPEAPPAPPPAAVVEAAPAPAPVQQVPELQVSLFGVQMQPTGAQALLARPGEPVPQWVRKGEAVDGWTLTDVDKNSVKFLAGETTRTVELHVPLPIPSDDLSQ